MSAREPRNPFNVLLLVFCILFVITLLAVVFVPYLEDRARDRGAEVPPSPFRDLLRSDGWRIVAFEAAGIVIFAAAMGLDRLRRHRRESASAERGKP